MGAERGPSNSAACARDVYSITQSHSYLRRTRLECDAECDTDNYRLNQVWPDPVFPQSTSPRLSVSRSRASSFFAVDASKFRAILRLAARAGALDLSARGDATLSAASESHAGAAVSPKPRPPSDQPRRNRAVAPSPYRPRPSPSCQLEHSVATLWRCASSRAASPRAEAAAAAASFFACAAGSAAAEWFYRRAAVNRLKRCSVRARVPHGYHAVQTQRTPRNGNRRLARLWRSAGI